MPNYAIYLRKSRADIELEVLGEMETLAKHEAALIALAKRQNLPITKIYKELVSGDTIADRPVVQQLIDEVENGEWNGVLVMEIERLARGDTIDQGIIARAFRLNNTKIITPIKTYDPSNEFDEEYFEFGLFMSRREYKTIKRRLYRGRVATVKEGKFIGSTAPYGYNKVRVTDGKGFTLAPNDEAETVKLIYKLYLSGDGMSVIALKLDQMRIPPRNRDTWSKSTISDILKNPVYAGKIRWAYRKEKLRKDGSELKKVRVSDSDCVLVDGLHPEIVSIEDFEQAQTIMKSHTRAPVKNDLELKNPFTGLLYCAKCGAKMTRLSSNAKTPYDTVKCSNRYCDNVSAPLFLVERAVISGIDSWLREYELAVDCKKNKTPPKNDNKKILTALDEEESKLKKQLEKTYDLLEQGIYTPEIFTKRNSAISKKLDDISVSRQEILSKQAEAPKQTPAEFIAEVKKLKAIYTELSEAKDKNALLRRIFYKITYSKDKANTRGNLENNNFDIVVSPKFPK